MMPTSVRAPHFAGPRHGREAVFAERRNRRSKFCALGSQSCEVGSQFPGDRPGISAVRPALAAIAKEMMEAHFEIPVRHPANFRRRPGIAETPIGFWAGPFQGQRPAEGSRPGRPGISLRFPAGWRGHFPGWETSRPISEAQIPMAGSVDGIGLLSPLSPFRPL